MNSADSSSIRHGRRGGSETRTLHSQSIVNGNFLACLLCRVSYVFELHSSRVSRSPIRLSMSGVGRLRSFQLPHLGGLRMNSQLTRSFIATVFSIARNYDSAILLSLLSFQHFGVGVSAIVATSCPR